MALLGLLTLAATAASAQGLNYLAANAQNAAGTYTDLGSAGSVIATANTDDANSAVQSIGFSFSYNGQSFTQFILNTNGFIKLGNVAPSGGLNVIGGIDPADTNILAAISYTDLYGALNQTTSPTEYRVSTTGAAGNRVCTIQFKNLADKPGTVPAQYATMQFQIKLYEGSNTIEFVYGTWTPTTAAATSQPFVIGLKGSSNGVADRLMVAKSAASAWSTSTFTAGVAGSLAGHFTTNAVLPDAGRTYRFRAPQQNDAEVQVVYTLRKLPRSGAHVIQAVVRNVGVQAQTSLPVTLSVTGANTFSNTKQTGTLASGASETITFDAFTPANQGTNTVTVNLPLADDSPTNNSRNLTQEVTDNVLGYAGSTPDSQSGLGLPTAYTAGALANKYTVASARTLTGVDAYLLAGTTANPAVGRTIYAVALSSTGVLLARTPDYVLTAADANTRKSFTFPTPVSLTAGSFYVGIAQTNPTGATQFYPIATQGENPTRTGAYYVFTTMNATGANTPQDLGSSNLGAFLIDAVLNVTTGTSKALAGAVNVYPNPSTGEFTLKIQGANAKSSLQVEVSNLLGQRVYAASARDNFENKLNLSHLANGLYTLKVLDGDQYMMRTISISK
ncbi:hypothetical protein DLM85_23950 [Hymenobacter edaphi]|uniref:Secretion system C-terminal sorting domain-containing protein n=1 Tax=Hymenobacter edaphi TaxID=2211146 RepID=A0A328B900_9BACT|nr:hypothetical protein DLM85_23950 [Hymenobacter edaphi]